MTPGRIAILALVAVVIALCGVSLIRQSNADPALGIGKAFLGLVCFIVAGAFALTAGLTWGLT